MTFLLQIPKRSACCSLDQQPFQEGMEYYSFIQHQKENIYLRQDYCQNCWQNIQKSERTFWKGKIQGKEEKSLKSSEERALQYLEEILQIEAKKQEAFILALFLVRKKVLAFRKSIENFDLYEKLETGEMLSIPKVTLAQLDVACLQKNLAERLNG